MRILVLGGTRFIGRRTVEKLRAAGHELSLVHRGRHDPIGVPGVTHLHGDRDQLGEVLPKDRTWDVLLDNCALRPAQVDVARSVLDGRVGRVVQVGSISVYQRYGPEPLTEAFPRQACTPAEAEDTTMDTYCQRKAECERRAMGWGAEAGVSVAVAHPGIVIGRGDYTPRVDQWLTGARSGVVTAVLAYDLAPLVWVEDVAEALYTLVTGTAAGAYNLALPGQRTLADWLARLREVVGADFRVEPAAPGVVPGLQSDEPITMDVSRARRDLGFMPRPVEEALREIVAGEVA